MFHKDFSYYIPSLLNSRLKLEFKKICFVKLGECLFQVTVSNYWEAIGVVAAHKAGVDPYSLRKNRIKNIQHKSSITSNGHTVSVSR